MLEGGPTFEHLGVLGLVVLIRTFLSVSLSVEVEGAWPWGRRTPERLPDEACNPSLSRYRERMLSSAVEGASTPPARPTRQLDASFARQTVPAPWNSAGIVKLLSLGQASWRIAAVAERQSSRCSNPADIGPHLERTRPCGSMFSGGDVVAAEMEKVGDLVVGREEALCLPR